MALKLRQRIAAAIGGKSWWQDFLRQEEDAGGSSASVRFGSDSDYLNALQTIDTVYKCASLVGRSIRRPSWWFERVGGQKKNQVIEIPDLATLLRRPTPYCSGKDLFEATISYLDLCGKAYWFLGEMDALSLMRTEKDAGGQTVVQLAQDGTPIFKRPDNPMAGGTPKQIWYLRPDTVTPIPGGPGELISGYRYEPSPGVKYELRAGEVIYFRRFDPISMMDGLGIVEAIRMTLEIDEEAKRWNRDIFSNYGVPPFALTTDQKITDDDYKTIIARVKERLLGRKNRFIPMLLGSGAKPFLLNMSAKDMDFLALRKFNREEICGAWGVPPAKLGIFEAGALGQANTGEQDKTFWGEGMEPRMSLLADKISTELVPRFDASAEFVWEDMTPDDMVAQAGIGKTLVESAQMTPNEARQRFGWGEEIEGGDTLFIASSLIPVSEAMKPRPSLADLQALGSQTPEGDEPPPNDENPEEPSPTEEPVEPKRLPPGMLRNGKRYRKSLPESDKELTRGKFRKSALKEFQRQEREVMAGAEAALADYAAKHAKDAAEQIPSPDDEAMAEILGSMANWQELAKDFRKAMRTEYVNAIALAGEIALADLGVDTIFNPTHPAILDWLATYMPILEDSVMNTTQGALSVAIRNGIESNLALPELLDAVREVFKTAKNARAEVIAITEGNRALNEGELQAWRQSGIVVAKQWVLGPNPCDICLDVAGRVMEINTSFYVTGDTVTSESGETIEIDYVDVEFPPLHSNCVCSIIPILQEAA